MHRAGAALALHPSLACPCVEARRYLHPLAQVAGRGGEGAPAAPPAGPGGPARPADRGAGARAGRCSVGCMTFAAVGRARGAPLAQCAQAAVRGSRSLPADASLGAPLPRPCPALAPARWRWSSPRSRASTSRAPGPRSSRTCWPSCRRAPGWLSGWLSGRSREVSWHVLQVGTVNPTSCGLGHPSARLCTRRTPASWCSAACTWCCTTS